MSRFYLVNVQLNAPIRPEGAHQHLHSLLVIYLEALTIRLTVTLTETVSWIHRNLYVKLEYQIICIEHV